MKKTQHITLGLLAGMALAFTSGCNRPPEHRDCVDMLGRKADDQNCQLADEQRRTGYGGSPGFRYWYGGSSGGHIGDVVVNGSPAPSASSGGGGFFGGDGGGVSRGGFGGFGGGGE
ncbi:MAG: hypothetical protein WA532_08450 [Candidatus Korobacteraceae bacterium]